MSTAALLMLLAGCQKEENGNRGGEKINLTADLSQEMVTKVDVDFNTDKAEVFWTDGDGVSVFGKARASSTNKYLGVIKTTLAERSKKAVFEGQVDSSVDQSYFVFYPNSASHSENDGLSIPLNLESQSGKADGFTYLSDYMYMFGKEPGQMDNNNHVAFSMEHACALLQFNVALKEVKEGITLKGITVSGENIKNKKTLNVYDKSVEDVAGAGNKITLSYPDGGPVLSTTEVTVAMAAFPAESGTVDVAVTVDNNGTEQTISISGAVVVFEAGKRYTKALILDVPEPDTETVYVAEYDFSNKISFLWVNGVVQQLLVDGLSKIQAMSVYASGSDVYVAGNGQGESSSSGAAFLWKNGVGKILTDGTNVTQATSVYVSGDDVYVSGSVKENNIYIATFWKNGTANRLVEGAVNATVAQSVYVSGSDVFVAGYEGDPYNRAAILWTNGTPVSLTDGNNRAEAKSVYVSGEDVYVTGYEGQYAVLWKNGMAQRLTDGTNSAEATSVCVSGGDVYVAGYDDTSAVLWKNGVARQLAGYEFARATSVYVRNGDVYVVGFGMEGRNYIGLLWKNEDEVKKISDDTGYMMPYSVFVK